MSFNKEIRTLKQDNGKKKPSSQYPKKDFAYKLYKLRKERVCFWGPQNLLGPSKMTKLLDSWPLGHLKIFFFKNSNFFFFFFFNLLKHQNCIYREGLGRWDLDQHIKREKTQVWMHCHDEATRGYGIHICTWILPFLVLRSSFWPKTALRELSIFTHLKQIWQLLTTNYSFLHSKACLEARKLMHFFLII